jgi:hypothetical protein
MTNPLYPFDSTGSASTNLIVNETHDLTELVIGPTKINKHKYQILLPTYTPFYSNKFMLKHMSGSGTLKDLVKDTDYRLILPYLAATKSIALDIFGGVELLNPITGGTLKMYYQTLGGDWIASADHVISRINEKARFSPNYTVWDILTDRTDVFPVINHDYSTDFINGHDELLAAINNIVPEIYKGHGNSLIDIEHFIDINNPHKVTKTQIGLSDVVDYPPLTLVEAHNLDPVDKYVTVVTLAEVITTLEGKVTMSGPTSLKVNQSGTFTITNYLCFLKYKTTTIRGNAVVKNNTVVYKAPSVTGLYGFKINGVSVNVTITA